MYKYIYKDKEYISWYDIRNEFFKNVSFPEEITDEIMEEFGVKRVEIPVTVQELANNCWEHIKSIRNQKEQDGCSYMGSTLDSDSVSVQRINTAIQAAQTLTTMGQEFNVDWTMQDNSVINMDSKDIMGMSIALVVMSNTLHQKARAYREQINQFVADFEAGIITEEAAKTALNAVDWQD